MKETALDLLELLLSITGEFKDQMAPKQRRIWSDVATKTADLRDGEDV
jgi:hypothetical protein